MKDLYSPQSCTVDARQPGTVHLTLDWFANKGYYPPRAGVLIEPLVNGQAAFSAVHEAIENAQQSVDIITWGFDPAMRFKRPGGLRAGELLAAKGGKGVKVRVLVWRNLLAALKENTTPGAGIGGSGGGAMGSGIGSGMAADNEVFRLDRQRNDNLREIDFLNTALQRSQQRPPRGEMLDLAPELAARRQARIAQLEAENADIESFFNRAEVQGYNHLSGSGGTQQDPWGQIYTRDWFKSVRSAQMKNVEFRTRDFAQLPQQLMNSEQVRLVRGRIDILINLLRAEGIDDLSVGQMLLLTQFASHHQKMVLIDYGTSNANAFVMGHNMHRNYWDTDAHLFDDRAAGRDPGFGPWQDISMHVKGPVLTDLNQNFAEAWDLEQVWYNRWFPATSLAAERNALPMPRVATRGAHSVAQICRTQPQDDETSILEHYLKAIGNATDYVYMENQYFRYPDFAKRLANIGQIRKSRGVPGDLYLFVITNTPDSSTASATTYAMLKGLGQDQLMPQVQRDLVHSLREHQEELERLNNDLHLDPFVRRGQLNRVGRLETKIAELRKQGVTPEVERRMDGLKTEDVPQLAGKTGDDEKPYQLTDLPGLKVLVATLATSDPAPGSPQPERMSPQAEAALGAPPAKACYKHIYVHSKLLLVDDVYTLLSSANINIRSMHSDSELGIAQPNPTLAKPLREKLWGMHAGKLRKDTAKNYEFWNEQMNKNWRAQNTGEPLGSHLLRFWDVTTPYSPALTVD
jgi:phosphatidylserine/phosphatidylglycerophosphate/cardiolipin synthase-like enzyme